MNNKLKIITSQDENQPGNMLFLMDEGERSKIVYKNAETGELVIVSNLTSGYDKPIRCSELYSKLKDRAWNKVDGLRFINLDDGEVLMYRFYNNQVQGNMPVSDIDVIDSTTYSNLNIKSIISSNPETGAKTIDNEKLEQTRGFYMQGRVRADSQGYKELDQKYKELFGNMNATEEVYFYNSSKNTVDILNGAVTLDLIKTNSDTYTDTISLNELISYSSAPSISGKVDITVQYSKIEGNGDEVNVYSHDTTISAFRYNTLEELEKEDVIEEINGDVQVEYIGGVLKVVPITNNINECIINNCTVTYGKIE